MSKVSPKVKVLSDVSVSNASFAQYGFVDLYGYVPPCNNNEYRDEIPSSQVPTELETSRQRTPQPKAAVSTPPPPPSSPPEQQKKQEPSGPSSSKASPRISGFARLHQTFAPLPVHAKKNLSVIKGSQDKLPNDKNEDEDEDEEEEEEEECITLSSDGGSSALPSDKSESGTDLLLKAFLKKLAKNNEDAKKKQDEILNELKRLEKRHSHLSLAYKRYAKEVEDSSNLLKKFKPNS